MITERGEIWTREHDIRAATEWFRAKAVEYRRRRLALQVRFGAENHNLTEGTNMKVRLTGINEEEIFRPVSNVTATAAVNEPPAPSPVVLAKLANLDGEPYSFMQVPAELVGDAKIGDEFTLFLERTRQ